MEITHIKPLHEARASQVAIKSGRTGEHIPSPKWRFWVWTWGCESQRLHSNVSVLLSMVRVHSFLRIL